METDDTASILNEILQRIKRIETLLQSNLNVNVIESEKVEESSESYLDIIGILDIVSKIDSNLVPTIKAILSKGGESSAIDIATITKRSRSRENQHLNHLVELGYVQKKRDGREIIFYLK